jgi:chromosomal replication initiation ATPase DnaA
VSDRKQLLFAFDHAPSLHEEDFLVADDNREAHAWLERWPHWPSSVLVVHGPPGCGKTHLLHVFLARTGGMPLTLPDLESGQIVARLDAAPAWALDDAERHLGPAHQEALLHAYNRICETKRHLLLTAREPPARWPVGLADLGSRLRATPAAGIRSPGDPLMRAVLVKLFADRQLQVDDGVLTYVLSHMERTFDAARSIVARIDETALHGHRRITIALVREVLNAGVQNA